MREVNELGIGMVISWISSSKIWTSGIQPGLKGVFFFEVGFRVATVGRFEAAFRMGSPLDVRVDESALSWLEPVGTWMSSSPLAL